jgi:hypothetical protein
MHVLSARLRRAQTTHTYAKTTYMYLARAKVGLSKLAPGAESVRNSTHHVGYKTVRPAYQP